MKSNNEEYDIYIEGSYPFQPPRLYKLLPKFPEIIGSDLLEACIKQSWSEGMSLLSIVSSLPCSLDGKFHLGHTFPLYLFSSYATFPCQILNSSNYKPNQQLLMIIAQTHLFQVQKFNSTSGHLVAYGTIKSIKELKISSQDKLRFTIVWRGTVDFIQVFKSDKCKEIVENLLKCANNQGIKTNKIAIINKFIKEEEVSPQFILRIKINEIESEIIETELELEHELEKSKINSLIQLYQKAIEYYSAIGDDKFDLFLGKIRNLMGSNEVLAVLSEEKHEAIISDSHIAKELEELEVWPENNPN